MSSAASTLLATVQQLKSDTFRARMECDTLGQELGYHRKTLADVQADEKALTDDVARLETLLAGVSHTVRDAKATADAARADTRERERRVLHATKRCAQLLKEIQSGGFPTNEDLVSLYGPGGVLASMHRIVAGGLVSTLSTLDSKLCDEPTAPEPASTAVGEPSDVGGVAAALRGAVTPTQRDLAEPVL